MSFIFNGISSDSLGLIVTNPVFRPSWMEEHNELSIPGRSRKLNIATGIYRDEELTVQTAITDVTKIKDIYSVIRGGGNLILSSAPDECLHAAVKSLIPEGVALKMAVLPITFLIEPFAYALEPTTAEIKKSYTLIRNPGTIYSEPVITFKSPASAEPVLMGDVDMDGKITAADAALVMEEVGRLAGGMEGNFTERQKAAADMDGDGKLTAADAAAILSLYAQQSAATSGAVSEQIIIDVNGAKLIVGLPASAVGNDYTITIDSAEKLIYYTNGDGKRVNIMQYSYGDLPLLHTGDNYAKFSGNAADVMITANERWL